MKYVSTRGKSKILSFTEIITSGLAPDGGLYMPEKIPSFHINEILEWKSLSYQELMLKIISPFIEGEIAENDLKNLIEESYGDFRDKKIAPLTPIGENEYLLELFHGPTLAFKDFALQFLGRLLDYTLKKQQKNVVIIGATSGDTGSAAIEGCKNSSHVQIFMLHPAGKTSDIQRKQMTSVIADNVHNLAIEGNFDDCQNMVKEMFRHPEFADGHNLVAVNSINWVRIMAQIVYYFYAFLQLPERKESIAFSVPTGNFGDILAGYIASKMGLPVSELIVATNSNNILDRFFQHNDYRKSGVKPTLSPSMDIQISSNFERLLFDIYDYDDKTISALMEKFQKDGRLAISEEKFKKVKSIFDSHSTNDELTKKTIKEVFDVTGEIIDPHTATGVTAARERRNNNEIPMVIVATAHPAKFPKAIEDTGVESPPLPPHLSKLMSAPEKFERLPDNLEKVKSFIKEHLCPPK